ncbi:MAG: helix-turn-helix transcriptional regulator [Sporocytophaga sp.]|uniref:helix-turn-helix transcriptional regulator n=1 Tax=Sporocytophaga sp. TaxID=2231183 RepID=UPI001B2AA4AF|nr:AraC family transcriptional regulator [Sporocytophaga sp.]MBO9699071.1 helix-turn-helix transcriptional regulator [Sporocytophaga sp.]
MKKDQYPKMYLYKRIVQAKLYIDNHYANNIDLNDISDEAYFSKFHFIRLFKSIYGKTPHQYLTQVRIENAKLLLAKEITISEVCSIVGFDSVSTFTGLFKKNVGVTPAVFKQQQNLRNSEISTNPLRFIPNCFAETHGWVKNSNFEEESL